MPSFEASRRRPGTVSKARHSDYPVVASSNAAAPGLRTSSCSPDGNPLTRDSRGPFWSELLGTPGENPPTHHRTPEDYIQRALDRQPELPLSRRGNGMRYSRPTQASNGNQREGWKELHIAALRAPHLCLAAPTPPLAPASLHDWQCLL